MWFFCFKVLRTCFSLADILFSYVVPVVFVVLIAIVAIIIAGVFVWKNRKLRYQNYRLVKEAGQVGPALLEYLTRRYFVYDV